MKERESNGPIGVFDSGVGGLTVLRALEEELPGEDFIYFGDTARLPYGSKSEDTILRYTFEDALFLLRKSAKFLVVACNSMSSVALPELQRYFKIPIVGVIEPAARAAVQESSGAGIGIIGTSATIRSRAYQRAVEELAPGMKTASAPCPLFVPLAEEGWQDQAPCSDIAEHYLSDLKSEGIDTLILGCTHYPLLRTVISRVMGDSVALVDSALATATTVKSELKAKGLLRSTNSAGETCFFLSDFQEHFKEIASRILKRELIKVQIAQAGD